MAGIPEKHDPGGKVRLAAPPDAKSFAVFGGPNKCYRYQLRRTWDKTKPHIMFIMMNPSRADVTEDDRTVAKCYRFAKTWGVYGGIYVGNTFAYRATDKKHLRVIPDPVGPKNDEHLIAMTKLAEKVIFAYGQPGHRSLQDRGQRVAKMLIGTGVKPYVLKLSKDRTPCHPLYLRKTCEPVPWKL